MPRYGPVFQAIFFGAADMSGSYCEKLKSFLEDSDVGHDMAAPLRQGCVVFTSIEGDDMKYEFVKTGNKCVLCKRRSKKADMYFKFTRGSLDIILEPPPENVKILMNRIFDCLLEKDETKKAELIIFTNFIDAASKGYFKMLRLGGSRAFPALAAVGIKIPLIFK